MLVQRYVKRRTNTAKRKTDASVPQIGHGRVGLEALPRPPSEVAGQSQPDEAQVGPLVDAPQRHLDPAALGQMAGHATAGPGPLGRRRRLLGGGSAPLPLPGGGIGGVVVLLVVLGLDGRVRQVVRIEVGQVAALQEGRARHQLLFREDGVDVVVRVLRHDQLCFVLGWGWRAMDDCNDTTIRQLAKWALCPLQSKRRKNGGKREDARQPKCENNNSHFGKGIPLNYDTANRHHNGAMGKKSKGRKPKGKKPTGGATADAVAGIDVAATAALLLSTGIGTSGAATDATSGNKPKSEKDEAPTKLLCSACGAKSDTLKQCNGCKCVWYCDKECQNKHRKEHKHECRVIMKELNKRGGKLDIGTEKDLGSLPDLPEQEECPICMRFMPIHNMLRTYMSCCGKTLCCGCDFQHQLKSGGQAGPHTCAFCRTALPQSEEERSARLRKRVELKDPNALHNMAIDYGHGDEGLPLDQAKCIELLREAAGLGHSPSQSQLGQFYDFGQMGLQRNEEEAHKCYKAAAEGGHLRSLHNLGGMASENGDFVAALRHLRLAASRGHKKSMAKLIICFENGLFRHDDLSETLQAFNLTRTEMRSKDRDQFIGYLKNVGEYHAEFDM